MNLRKSLQKSKPQEKVIKKSKIKDSVLLIVDGRIYQQVDDNGGGCDICDMDSNSCNLTETHGWHCDTDHEDEEWVLKEITDTTTIIKEG